MTDPLRPAPYAADVRARGWRFELDYEQIEQSDTWSLAAEVPMSQHALLMMWMVAWTQVPCGSLPNDESIIRVKCKVPPKMWAALRPILMRGWWAADDSRLYHDTIVKRVGEMLEYRRKEAERRSRNRKPPAAVPPVSRGTTPEQHPEDTGVPDTGTGTGTYTPSIEGVPHATPGQACKAMKAAGMADLNPSHPKLQELLLAGMTLPELVTAAGEAVKKGKPFAYALATAEGRRRDAATAPLPAMAAGAAEPALTFAEKDRRAGWQRWEEMTGQRHPELEKVRAQHGDVIDVTPSQPRITHDAAH